MDPLSIAASIAGLATAASEVANILKPYVSALSNEVPQIALRVHAEVESTRTILAAVERLTSNLALARNTALIQVDHVVAVLTDGVLVFSELEEAVGELRVDPSSGSLPLRARVLWNRKESTLMTLLGRLQGFKISTNLILTVLNWYDVHRMKLTSAALNLFSATQTGELNSIKPSSRPALTSFWRVIKS
jgi:cell division control protein 24